MVESVAAHYGAVKQLNRNGQICADAQTAGVANAFTATAKAVLEKNDLTAYRDNPLTLLAKVLAGQEWAELLAQKENRLAAAGQYSAKEPGDLVRIDGREYVTSEPPAALEQTEAPQEPVTPQEPARQHAVAASTPNALGDDVDDVAAQWAELLAQTAVVEMLPAYRVKPPLQGRLIAHAVGQAKHLGGVSAADAERLHAVYLARRADHTLWAETDLAVLAKELGRPLALAELAMYGSRLTVNRDAWQQAEQGDSQPVNVLHAVTV
jgi:hypothetical protein